MIGSEGFVGGGGGCGTCGGCSCSCGCGRHGKLAGAARESRRAAAVVCIFGSESTDKQVVVMHVAVALYNNDPAAVDVCSHCIKHV